MTPAYIEALAKALAPVIKAAVASEVGAARREVEAVRQECDGLRKQLAVTPVPTNDKDADMDALRAFIVEQVAALPPPKDGVSVTLQDVAPIVREEVRAEVASHLQAIPHPKDGKSVTLEDIRPMLDDAIKQLRADADEAIAEPLRLAEAARDALCKAVGDLRQPEDGKSVTIADIQPVLAGAIEVIKADAAAAVDAAIKAIPVVKDGEPGKSITAEDIAPVLELNVAKWALEFERRGNDTVQRVLDKIVQPKDGEPGRDGLGFDDLAVEYDGEKTVTLKMQRGEVIKEANIVLPINIDRGIFKEGQSYTAGDSVTWGGSYWIAKRDTSAKPDGPDSGWRLAVKKGRDGKDGRDGIDKTAPVRLKD